MMPTAAADAVTDSRLSVISASVSLPSLLSNRSQQLQRLLPLYFGACFLSVHRQSFLVTCNARLPLADCHSCRRCRCFFVHERRKIPKRKADCTSRKQHQEGSQRREERDKNGINRTHTHTQEDGRDGQQLCTHDHDCGKRERERDFQMRASIPHTHKSKRVCSGKSIGKQASTHKHNRQQNTTAGQAKERRHQNVHSVSHAVSVDR